MTVIDIQPIQQTVVEDMFDAEHFICCRIPDEFVGVTTAFCGKKVIVDSVKTIDAPVNCSSCVTLELTNPCPIDYGCGE